MCNYDYGESPEFWRQRDVRSRKPRTCDECGRGVAPGEAHRYIATKFDGSFYDYRICPHCVVACALLVRECDGYLLGGVLDDLGEHVDRSYPWAVEAGRIVVGMRRKWQRFDGAGLMPVPVLRYTESARERARHERQIAEIGEMMRGPQ